MCIETENVNVPFTYKVYSTYDECVNAPENNVDSSCGHGAPSGATGDFNRPSEKWFIDANRGRCQPSFMSSAPFNSATQCRNALGRCGSDGLPAIQFSNPIQAPDAHWREPYAGFSKGTSRNVDTMMQPPQVPLNPPDRVPVSRKISNHTWFSRSRIWSLLIQVGNKE